MEKKSDKKRKKADVDLTADSDNSSGGAEEAGVGLVDVEGYCRIGEDTC